MLWRGGSCLRDGAHLRYVFIDGEMVNLKLLNGGWGEVAQFPASFEKFEEFFKAESLARTDGRGTWSVEASSPVPSSSEAPLKSPGRPQAQEFRWRHASCPSRLSIRLWRRVRIFWFRHACHQRERRSAVWRASVPRAGEPVLLHHCRRARAGRPLVLRRSRGADSGLEKVQAVGNLWN